MAAGYNQCHGRETLLGLFEHYRLQMAVQMVDGDEWFLPGPGERFCRCHGDQQCRRQSWAVCDCHGVKVMRFDLRSVECLLYYRQEVFDMGASGDFGRASLP